MKTTGFILSRDYEHLYDLICDGHTIVGFVDYFAGVEKFEGKHMDVCKIKKFQDYEIEFFVRGICYGSVRYYNKDNGTEKELFIDECVRLKLEYYTPHIQPTEKSSETIINDSLKALDDYLKNTPKEQLEKDFKEIEDMGFTGPTVEEYFNPHLIYENEIERLSNELEAVKNELNKYKEKYDGSMLGDII